MRTISQLVVLSFLLAAASASILSAQTFRGTLLGTITDATGAVIPGVSISVKNMDTGIERTTESNSDGAFTVPELPVGRYSVSATKTGFNPYQAEGLEVTVGSQMNLNITLQTGAQKEEVVVSSNALQVETTSNTLGATLTTNEVKNLPVNGRDYTKLIYLSPGVTGSPDQISDSPGSFGAFSV
ncbi:MAG TPA: carboxypeptidase-like regulatory domain-containing protein, partial [Acidobacteriaceae bacterium]|nr:carboxypeptidase-like regulatory domain-containing protein [Acidobacteriaceae bacterium]